jgi:hypothetical protein
MAQKAAREAQVVIADQTYRVCFSILGIVALRDRWNLESDDQVMIKLEQMGREFGGTAGSAKFDFKLIGDLIWAGLRRYHPEVTPDQCLVMMDDVGLDGLPSVMQTIFGTLAAAAPPQGARQARPRKAINGVSRSTS